MDVYIAARDLAGVPIGTHQFIIIVVTINPYPAARLAGQQVLARDLGNGSLGYVIGAQNRGNLVAEYFEESDLEAAREHFDPRRLSWFRSDFDTEAVKVKFKNKTTVEGAKRIFELIENYSINESMDKIPYPRGGIGYNSNSWAQTVISLAGGIGTSDFSGADIGNDKRIPKIYFDPICLVEPRPKINE